VILREHGYPRSRVLDPSGCVFKLSSPRHLRCQIPRQTKPGFFIRERCLLLALSGHWHVHRKCLLLTQSGHHQVAQFRAAPYRLRTATHRLPISSCGAAAKVAPHFHKAAALTCWCRSHSRMAAYLHGIRSFRVSFRSNAVAVSQLVMHIRATTVNNRLMTLLAFAGPPRLAA